MRVKPLFAVWGAVFFSVIAAAGQPPLTVDDVVKLVQNKISDNVIIAQIEETNTYFSLSTDDLIKLKQAGASDNLVTYMLMRKPGGPPPTKTVSPATAAGPAVTVNTAGRPATTPAATAEAGPPAGQPAAKFVDVSVTVDGKYVVTSGADLNIYFAAYLDGERKYYRDQWSRILTVTTAETGASAKKWILEPGTFTFKAPTGTHTLSIACWSGPGTIDDAAAKAYVVYSQPLNIAEGQPVLLKLTGVTDEATGKFSLSR